MSQAIVRAACLLLSCWLPALCQQIDDIDSGVSSPALGFIDPGFAGEYFIGKNNRLPDGEWFLLGGKDLFIVKKQLSKHIDLGMAGGPVFRVSLIMPDLFISNVLYAADRNVTICCSMLAPEDGFSTVNGPPFNETVHDGDRIRITTYRNVEFPGAELRSLQWYLNARLPQGDAYLMIKPLAFGEHVIYESRLFKAKYDHTNSTMLFSEEEEATTDFPVRNIGINVDAAVNRRIDRRLTVYVRCPVECRRVTTDAKRSIIARFAHHPDDEMRYYRYVKLDTLSVKRSKAAYLYLSPRIGMRIDSRARLAWPFIFLPFVAQNSTIEGYYSASRLREWGFDEQHPWNEIFGGSLTSFQKIRFGGSLISGMENLFRADLYGLYNKRYLESQIHSEYIPQLVFKERFFFSGLRICVKYYRPDIYVDIYNQYGFGFASAKWGFAFSIAPKSWLTRESDPDAFNVTLWRVWK